MILNTCWIRGHFLPFGSFQEDIKLSLTEYGSLRTQSYGISTDNNLPILYVTWSFGIGRSKGGLAITFSLHTCPQKSSSPCLDSLKHMRHASRNLGLEGGVTCCWILPVCKGRIWFRLLFFRRCVTVDLEVQVAKSNKMPRTTPVPTVTVLIIITVVDFIGWMRGNTDMSDLHQAFQSRIPWICTARHLGLKSSYVAPGMTDIWHINASIVWHTYEYTCDIAYSYLDCRFWSKSGYILYECMRCAMCIWIII